MSVFNKNYQKIVTNKNLFIVLDSTVDPGSISKDQMVFLRKESGAIALFSTTRVVYSAPNYDLNYTY